MMPATRSFLLRISLAALCAVSIGKLCAQELEYLPDLPIDHPAIRYFQVPLDNAVTRLVHDMETGKTKLTAREDGLGYLPSLLDHFGIHIDSQALVFSKTSFQAAKISPTNPRAIYFTDDVAVAFVRGSENIEVAATDATDGVVFYTTNIRSSEQPVFERRDVCLKCHQGPATSGVPGLFIGSVFPSSVGTPFRGASAIITDHRTKFEDRWGGWYINAKSGQQRDRANRVASNPATPEVLDEDVESENLTNLIGKFNPAGYLSPVSDIVALMTFEHQTQMTNYITRVGWEARMAQTDKANTRIQAGLDQDIEALVTYMLFAEEVPLPEPLVGVSSFTQTFPQRGPRDRQGRSLRDFDLKTRLFRYPLSFMIYSASFDALPDAVREQIYRRLYDVLSNKDQSATFAKLSSADRAAILDILRDTKPGLPDYWKPAVHTGKGLKQN